MSAFVHRRRRSVLALTAGAGLAAVLGLAGCSGSTDETLDAKAFAAAWAGAQHLRCEVAKVQTYLTKPE